MRSDESNGSLARLRRNVSGSLNEITGSNQPLLPTCTARGGKQSSRATQAVFGAVGFLLLMAVYRSSSSSSNAVLSTQPPTPLDERPEAMHMRVLRERAEKRTAPASEEKSSPASREPEAPAAAAERSAVRQSPAPSAVPDLAAKSEGGLPQPQQTLGGAPTSASGQAGMPAPGPVSRPIPADGSSASTPVPELAKKVTTVTHADLIKETLPCGDHHTQCKHWASQGECEHNKGYMHRSCGASCGLCTAPAGPDMGMPGATDSRAGTVTAAAATAPSATTALGTDRQTPAPSNAAASTDVHMHCADQHSRCASWAAAGECDKNVVFMHSSCALSCGKCIRQ